MFPKEKEKSMNCLKHLKVGDAVIIKDYNRGTREAIVTKVGSKWIYARSMWSVGDEVEYRASDSKFLRKDGWGHHNYGAAPYLYTKETLAEKNRRSKLISDILHAFDGGYVDELTTKQLEIIEAVINPEEKDEVAL